MSRSVEVRGRTPVDDGYSWPAEWEPHEACYVSWPNRADTWKGRLEHARRAYAEVVRAILGFEPVIVLCPPDALPDARERLPREVEIQPTELDDSWIRDNGPIFVRSRDGELAAVRFRFNGWGNRYPPYERDAAVPQVIAGRLGLPVYASSLVAEGGALAGDGKGTVVTTESCLLNPNRNPGLGKESVEAELHAFLGASRTLWLRKGIAATQVDGHVDALAAFARPGVLLAASAPDPMDENHRTFAENRERLLSETDARGKPLEVVELPSPRPLSLDGHRLAATYMNFYIANGGIVAPQFGDPSDGPALEVLRSTFPRHEVVGVRCNSIAIGGGDVHCITQQLPRLAREGSRGKG